jgi:hypothetical protein
MIDSDGSGLSEEEVYINAYFYFIKSLNILAEDAEAQCKKMGYFNVAWELRENVSRGAQAVLDHPNSNLSDKQREAIRQLLADLASIPDHVFRVANLKDEHVRSMNHPCWTPPTSARQRSDTFFGS